MNQILSVEPPKPKKEKRQKNSMGNSGGGTIEIEKIVRFFAIVLIVFGIIMIASGSYSMYQGTQTGNSQAKPTISVQEVSETQLELEISHSTPLQRVTYNWNNDQQVELDASGKKSVNQTIEIPTGDNTLNVYAVDQDGKETNYSRMYTREGDISIDFAVDGSNLKVTASGKNQLSYMTYRWDDEEEQRVDINNMDVEYSIEIPMGQHTLTVSVVDVNNTMETKEQEVKGVKKPTVEISLDDSKSFFVVNELLSSISSFISVGPHTLTVADSDGLPLSLIVSIPFTTSHFTAPFCPSASTMSTEYVADCVKFTFTLPMVFNALNASTLRAELSTAAIPSSVFLTPKLEA